ncbi:50S ribosomal protein L23 [bacterium]|jgi:large subunit ribosomal protein L23|nr:50S ribosomal protein L23 [bacterium]MBT3581173.1 50S ribosomal protein L23 [bacterium]MBT4551606.1 50S ribosomal protein L23 [bacterium]MBT5988192.1 50S ribosomal protein L23 [bacterium]MBT7087705.1 50S ribosomal protein L23 [bacterium]
MSVLLKKQIITEKSKDLTNDGQYTFSVDKRTNKLEVKKFIENYFDVKVEKVNIINQKGKKRVRRHKVVTTGFTADVKKAIVTLSKDSKLDKIKEIF